MIDAIIKAALQNKVFVIVGAAVLVALGALRITRMPVDVFPDLSAPTVTIVAEAHGMAPEEVERLVTFPLEAAINGATGVRRVRSSTSVGVAVVWVEFEWGADIYTARQIVTERLQRVQASLPPDLDPPQLAPITSIMGEILFVGLTSDTVHPRAVRTLADTEVRRRLLAVPGVAQVVPIGGEVKQFQVLVRPADLAAHRISLAEVVDAVRASNQNTSAGIYERGGQEHLIHGIGRVESPAEIAQAIVAPRPDAPVRILDVADVIIGDSLKRGDAAVNGRPAVVLGVQKQAGVNTLALTRRLDAVLDDIGARLPDGVVMHRRLLRQADFIGTGVTNVSHALRDGSILVILIVGLFLFSWRATIITALAIPLSLIASAVVLDALGATLNTMTLGGMAIAVGALVDDAIIDVENVVRRLRLRRGEDVSVTEIVFEASREIRGSIVFATLIIVLVFLPLFVLHGVEGLLLEPLGVAYVVALGASLLVALTITPVLCALLLPTSRAVLSGREPAGVRWLRAGYVRLLTPTLRAWPVLLGVAVVGVCVASLAAQRAGRTFLPEFNEGALTISVVTLPGTSLAESNQLGGLAERLLRQHPEIAATTRRTGRAELDEHALGVHVTEIEARLEMKDRSKPALLEALRADLRTLPGAQIVIGQPISHRIDHMISGTRANIAVKIFGPELSTLRRLADAAQARMATVPGVVDLGLETQATLPLATVRLDRAALARYGLRVRDVTETIETAFLGRVVSQVLLGEYAFDLVVRYPAAARTDLQSIRQTLLPTPSGAWVPLEAVAAVQHDRGPSEISREQGKRKLVVMSNVGAGHDLGSVVAGIQQRLADLPLPDGYHVEYGGQFEAAVRATRTLTLLSIGIALGVFLLLYMALSSVRDALLVMLNLPLALIGGVVGVFAAGGVISIASIIGFITLFGIATRNGIMLVTHMRHLMIEEGVGDPRAAVIRGASERLAPILMTALASGLGLLPLALAMGEPGSEIQAPMALVILFGLISSTVLNMFIVPALVLRFGSIRQKP